MCHRAERCSGGGAERGHAAARADRASRQFAARGAKLLDGREHAWIDRVGARRIGVGRSSRARSTSLTSENVVFRADTDRGIGEHIAICDEGVLLNCERLVRFTT